MQTLSRDLRRSLENTVREHHFAGAGKPITGGKGAVQVVDDYQLSRFACYHYRPG